MARAPEDSLHDWYLKQLCNCLTNINMPPSTEPGTREGGDHPYQGLPQFASVGATPAPPPGVSPQGPWAPNVYNSLPGDGSMAPLYTPAWGVQAPPTFGAQSSQMGAQSTQMGAQSSQMGAQSSLMSTQSSQMGAQSSKMAPQSSQMGAQSSLMGPQSSKMATHSSQMGAQSSQMGAQSSLMGAHTSQMGAQSFKMATQSSQMGAQSSQMGALSSKMAAQSSQMGTKASQKGTKSSQKAAKSSQMAVQSTPQPPDPSLSRGMTSEQLQLLRATERAKNVADVWVKEGRILARLVDDTVVGVSGKMDIWAIETMEMKFGRSCSRPATALYLFLNENEPASPWPKATAQPPQRGELSGNPGVASSSSSSSSGGDFMCDCEAKSDTPISDMFGFSIWGSNPVFPVPPQTIHQDVTGSPVDSAFNVARSRWQESRPAPPAPAKEQKQGGQGQGEVKVEKEKGKAPSKPRSELWAGLRNTSAREGAGPSGRGYWRGHRQGQEGWAPAKTRGDGKPQHGPE